MNSWPYTDVSGIDLPETYFTSNAPDYGLYTQANGHGQPLSPSYSPYSPYAATTSSQHSGYDQERAAASHFPPSRPSPSRTLSYHSAHQNPASPYPTSASHSPGFGFTPSPYATSPHGSPSPLTFPDIVDPSILDLDIMDCFFPGVPSSQPSSSSSPRASAPATSFACDYPSCTKSYPRLCDLRKHKKRHAKPFPCPMDSCEAVFSTEKDRDRHEKSKHRREEHLICPVCGHRTARKDNLKDHVRRRHGEEAMERIMRALSVGSSAG
jgi:hypothetical protein